MIFAFCSTIRSMSDKRMCSVNADESVKLVIERKHNTIARSEGKYYKECSTT